MEDEIIIPEAETAPTHAEVVDIQFRPGQKIYFFDPNGMEFVAGDHVIIDTARGAEFGYVTGGNHRIPMKDVVAPLRCVIRQATAQDEKTHEENRAKEARAYEICMQKIEAHGLDMQLVSAEYAFDGSKILFYFTADERVDFRELVKNLASIFHTRIELRQIGVRDKAKMVGGLGICGRPFCCASFLEDFQPVSIKMAKTQNLSLNPTKISGTCGRLMCCLKYEQDAYEDLIRNSPKVESFVDTPDGRGTVVELDLLRQRVKVRMEDRPEVIGVFSNTEIAVLRNGKAKKTDAPIPADLAPISGQGKRVRQTDDEDAPVLDPIRFRYSTESIVEEPEEPAPVEEEVMEEAPATQEKNRRRRNRRNKGAAKESPEEAAPKAEAAPEAKQQNRKKQPKNAEPKAQPEKQEAPNETQKEAPKEGAPEEAPAKKRNKHHYYRHRKPRPGGKAEG